jgi:hypothetical protein
MSWMVMEKIGVVDISEYMDVYDYMGEDKYFEGWMIWKVIKKTWSWNECSAKKRVDEDDKSGDWNI